MLFHRWCFNYTETSLCLTPIRKMLNVWMNEHEIIVQNVTHQDPAELRLSTRVSHTCRLFTFQSAFAPIVMSLQTYIALGVKIFFREEISGSKCIWHLFWSPLSLWDYDKTPFFLNSLLLLTFTHCGWKYLQHHQLMINNKLHFFSCFKLILLQGKMQNTDCNPSIYFCSDVKPLSPEFSLICELVHYIPVITSDLSRVWTVDGKTWHVCDIKQKLFCQSIYRKRIRLDCG